MSTGQKPSVGRIVLGVVDNVVRPGIITDVPASYDDDPRIDVEFFCGISHLYVQSLKLVDTREQAEALSPVFGAPAAAYWPPRA